MSLRLHGEGFPALSPSAMPSSTRRLEKAPFGRALFTGVSWTRGQAECG